MANLNTSTNEKMSDDKVLLSNIKKLVDLYQKETLATISIKDDAIVALFNRLTAGSAVANAALELLDVLDVDGPKTDVFDDDRSVGSFGDGKDMPMTFGHVRRLRTALDTFGQNSHQRRTP